MTLTMTATITDLFEVRIVCDPSGCATSYTRGSNLGWNCIQTAHSSAAYLSRNGWRRCHEYGMSPVSASVCMSYYESYHITYRISRVNRMCWAWNGFTCCGRQPLISMSSPLCQMLLLPTSNWCDGCQTICLQTRFTYITYVIWYSVVNW